MRKRERSELIVDSFAGGGGASLGIEWALGHGPDVAINHDADAIAMHAANHPDAEHHPKDIWSLSPHTVTKGKAVGLLWASPDCTHFSRAKGAKPVKKSIRSLAWVVVKWAAEVRPRVIILENVREFEDWGPLIPKVVDGVAQIDEDGSPVLVPDPSRKGHSFRRWVGRLRGLGYEVQWRVLNAADYGAPTHRRRLFLIARCDGQPIVWPEKTHCAPDKVGSKWDFDGRDATPINIPRLPWKTAAECIDWSIPCPSIFGRKKPLAPNTLRRIALGIKRYVLESSKPFIVQVNHGGNDFRGQAADEPLPTVTGKHGYGIVTPHVTKFRGNSVGSSAEEPLPTVTSGAGAKRPAGAAHALGVVSPFLARLGQTGGNGKYCQGVDEPATTITSKAEHLVVAPVIASLAHGGNGTFGDSRSHGVEEPVRTVHAGGNNHALVLAFLAKHFGGVVGQVVDAPASTVTAKDHHSLVAANLVHLNNNTQPSSPADPMLTVTGSGNHAALVYSFLVKYFGTAIGANLIEPMPTATGKDRFGLVTVQINGEPYVIVDIGMRMLSPRELARAQGFPDSYILTGSKSSQVARIGNSVCPVMAKVLAGANYQPAKATRRRNRA